MTAKKRAPAYAGSHRAEVTREGAYTYPITPDAPGKAGTKGPTASRRRGFQHEAPSEVKAEPKPKAEPKAKTPRKAASSKPSSGPPTRKPASSPPAPRGPSRAAAKPDASSDARERRRDALEEGRAYAHRQAVRATQGRPSTTGRAAAGAVAGGATGAALGGPPGAAVGAGLGGVGGAIAGSKAKRAYKAATSASPGARRIIVTEFALCLVIAALSPLTDRNKAEKPGAWMKRMTAIMGLFFILGLISTAGRGAAKFAAGLGGLVTVGLIISERDLFMKVGTIFRTSSTPDLIFGDTGTGSKTGGIEDMQAAE